MSAGALERRVAPRPSDRPPEVSSDADRLRTVLMHRPGAELDAVDPADPGGALFAGAVDLPALQAEHDAFTGRLRARGVEVLLLRDLLVEALAEPEQRAHVLARAAGPAAPEIREVVETATPEQLADLLIGAAAGPSPDPLPNLLYTRDAAAFVGRGIAVGRMAARVRRREASLVDALFRVHPRFAASTIWTDAASEPPRFEGGDLLVAGGGRVIVGISERTTRTGAHRLATALLSTGAADSVATLRIPRGAAFHLDLVLTLVDREAAALWRPLRGELRAHLWRRGPTGIEPSALPSLAAAFPGPVKLIEVDSEPPPHSPRAWDHGVNVLALGPGVVVAYAHNERANEQLARAGVEVLPIAGAALARGRGGPRCLSCPVLRESSGVDPR